MTDRTRVAPMPDVPRLVLCGSPHLLGAAGRRRHLGRHALYLLTLVALAAPLTRAQAAAMLYPELPDAEARRNLRQLLFSQHALLDPLLEQQGDLLALRAGTLVDALAEPAAAELDAPYRPLLQGMNFDELPSFQQWLDEIRESARQARLDRLAAAASAHEAAGQLARALALAQRLVAESPASEHGHRRLMRLHYLRGDRAAALAAFDHCEQVLKDELSARPEAETLALLHQIEGGEVARANGHEGQALPHFEVLWPDADPQQRPLYWAAEHSKRYFAAACATGTIDQLLLSVLQTKHAHLRGTVLLRSLVVVDEVHASDAYMTALLHAALQRQVRAGGRALLMSATLTGEARARLVLAGLPARDVARHRDALAVADAPYPCVSDSRQLLGCASAMPARHIRCQLLAAMRDPDAVAEIVATAVADGARVLVLRNTVAQAVATQQAIEARLGSDHPALFRVGGVGGVVAMHHGRYAFEDRQALDLEVEAAFGAKAATSRAARVLVGTQTLEISLDCDADLMLTDIVPMDVLLQRLGRLHRHRERDDYRPARIDSSELLPVLTCCLT